VFLDAALREKRLHPTQRNQPFTVKITGGPDGDVAGNMIRILMREYGDQGVKVVGLADVSGCAEDPNGLDSNELLRLVHGALPIACFDPSKLSDHQDSALHLIAAAEGCGDEKALRARNSMHNRVVADAFIPAGGRPSTINESNWRSFLQPNGEPSSKLIVEGANLFITPGARQLMYEETGIPIVKDSSANKCGVICSSYEILSSMLLSNEEFKAIKEPLVADVLKRLRFLAGQEAELLFREFRTLPGSLPDFSMRISNTINTLTDVMFADLDKRFPDGDYGPIRHLVKEYMPDKLFEVAEDRLEARVPKEYYKCILASSLASKMVYREGVMFVEQHTDAYLANLSFDYIEAEKACREVDQAMREVDWTGREKAGEIARRIVHDGGIRAYLSYSGGPLEKDFS